MPLPHTTIGGGKEKIRRRQFKEGWSRNLQNLPILREDIRIAEDIYGPIFPHLKVKTVRHKIKHVEPIIIENVPKGILDKYKKFTILCDPMQINGIGFLNTLFPRIMFATEIIIKNRKKE